MKLILLAVMSCLLLVGQCNHSKDIQKTDSHINEVYGPDARNRMDVYLPLNHDTNTQMILLIHGGAWVIGDKSNWPAAIVNGLLQQGFAVSSMNYRYACGDFHKQMEDVRLATDYLVSKRGQWKTARGKLGLVGVSAGGHLALLYAGAYDSSHQVKAVVSLAGPADLGDTLLKQFLGHYEIGFVLKRFLGASQNENPQVYKDASPMYHAPAVPCLFINGEKDDLVPAVQAFRLQDTLMAHKIPTDTLYFGNVGHNIFGPKNVNMQEITSEVNRWMRTYLR